MAPGGVTLRVATDADREFLFTTYASARAGELAVVPWTADERDAFLRQQFALQRAHYRANYAGAQESVIEADGVPIGRLYVHRAGTELCLMDIALLAGHRSRGIGGALIRELLDEAAAAGVPVTLHVEASNPARRLYARLGFVQVEQGPVYDRLEWRSSASSSAG